ncbi:hypothetical protein ACH5RR_030681 [Cinchona calisaya]|uniref:Uncharacterized protein n=1 Tax=Cinchona calisaya TaxID=153742 RepID=A0ABD2YVB5_9GENT
MLLSQTGQSTSTKDRNSVLDTSKSYIIREPSLVPKVGKAFEILRCLKINLLDMDATLTDASLRASRSHSNRRCAWRAFVNSAKSLYESSPSAASNISTLSALAFRMYTLDSAILYEKPVSTRDTPETLMPDCKSENEALQNSGPTINLKPANQLKRKVPDSDSGENSKPRIRASKGRKDSGT